MGKYIEMEFNDISENDAKDITDKSCKKLLANLVIEDFKII